MGNGFEIVEEIKLISDDAYITNAHKGVITSITDQSYE